MNRKRGSLWRIAATLATVLCAAPSHAADYALPVVRVIDGDTVEVNASPDMPPELAGLKVLLRGVDAPESRHRAKYPAASVPAGAASDGGKNR